MSNSPLNVLEYGEQIAKHAQREVFEFTVLGDGDVEIVNRSHCGSEEHTGIVHVEGKIPSYGTCPAWKYQERVYKHRVSVMVREPVLEAVNVEPTVKADVRVTAESGESNYSAERPVDCDCSPFFEALPCWPCYRDVFEEPNSHAEVNGE